MLLEEEVSPIWCLGLSSPSSCRVGCSTRSSYCTVSDSIGILSVLLFYTSIPIVTVIHYYSLINNNNNNNTHSPTATSSESHNGRTGIGGESTASSSLSSSRRIIVNNYATESGNGDEYAMIASILIYFFTFTAGCLLWVLDPAWVYYPFIHQDQQQDQQNNDNDNRQQIIIAYLQVTGSLMLTICLFLFIKVHIDLGDSWYPIPNSPPNLVTHGTFQFARHPMYAVIISCREREREVKHNSLILTK